MGSNAAKLLPGQAAKHACIRRSLLAKSLLSSKFFPKSHEQLSDVSSFIGKSLIYSPRTCSRDSIHVTADVRNFVKQCLSDKQGLWSIIAEIVIDVPNEALSNGVEYVIIPELLYLNSARKKRVIKSTTGINTVVYVCDERKMDGDSRHLLKNSLSIDKIMRRFTVNQIYVVVQMLPNRLQSSLQQNNSAYQRLMRAKESELKSIIKSKLRNHRYIVDTIHDVFNRTCKVFSFDHNSEQNGVDKLVGSLLEDTFRPEKAFSGVYEKLLSQIMFTCHHFQRYINDNIKYSHTSVHYFVFEQTLATLAQTRRHVQSGMPLFCYTPFDSFIKEWTNIMQINVGTILECWISIFSTDIRQVSRSEELEYASKRRRTEIDQKVEYKGTYQLLSWCTRLLQTTQVSSSMLRKLQHLNACILTGLRKKLTKLLCCTGLHSYALSLIKRSIMVKIKACQKVFDTAVSIDWLREVCESYFFDVFQEELLVKDILNLRVSTPSQLLRGAQNELCMCFNSRIQSVNMCYMIIMRGLFCAQSARDYASEILSGKDFVGDALRTQPCKGLMPVEFVRNRRRDLCSQSRIDITYSVVMDSICEIMQFLREKKRATPLLSQRVNVPASLRIRSDNISHLDRVILEGLNFIEREGLKRSSFFKAWGSDMLATFLFFREISYGIVRVV